MPSQTNINRGTLILLAPNAKDPNISASNIYFVFQYNPEKLLHTFNQPTPPTSASSTAPEPPRPPVELFNLTFELDSTDQELATENKTAAELGIHPALAMLETMMQPRVVGKQISMPSVVFKWGTKRSVAVHIVSIIVEENAFDITLNPTRATVNLTLRVLDANEVNTNAGARGVYSNHQDARATLVEVYKSQTGQAPAAGKVAAASAATTSAIGTSKESKTKLSA